MTAHWTYVLAPVVSYVVAGSTKFAVNSIRERRLAFGAVGLGGIPSTHSTVMSTASTVVGLGEGWLSPMFCLAASVSLIVILDALDLRRRVGSIARAVNELNRNAGSEARLRERM